MSDEISAFLKFIIPIIILFILYLVFLNWAKSNPRMMQNNIRYRIAREEAFLKAHEATYEEEQWAIRWCSDEKINMINADMTYIFRDPNWYDNHKRGQDFAMHLLLAKKGKLKGLGFYNGFELGLGEIREQTLRFAQAMVASLRNAGVTNVHYEITYNGNNVVFRPN